MAFAYTLPPSVIKVCRWFNAACLLLVILVCIDVFIFPRVIQTEKILGRDKRYFTIHNRYSSRPHISLSDIIVLVTENFRYSYSKDQGYSVKDFELAQEADSARLVTTFIFKMVEKAYLRSDNQEVELEPGAGVFGFLKFVPISFGLIAAFGVAMWRNKEQLLNAAVMNIVLIIFQLWLQGTLNLGSTP